MSGQWANKERGHVVHTDLHYLPPPKLPRRAWPVLRGCADRARLTTLRYFKRAILFCAPPFIAIGGFIQEEEFQRRRAKLDRLLKKGVSPEQHDCIDQLSKHTEGEERNRFSWWRQ